MNTSISHQRYADGEQDVSRFRLTAKELERASEDNVVIVSRPQGGGGSGYGVFALDVSDPAKPKAVTPYWLLVADKSDLAAATTEMSRSLDKFYGRGGDMSYQGRHRAGSKQARAAGVPDRYKRTTEDTDEPDKRAPMPLNDQEALELYTRLVTAAPARHGESPEADLERLRQLSGMPKDTPE
jgi:hypothetical protein